MIAFTEVNNQPVETLYVGDALHPEQPPQPHRYPRAEPTTPKCGGLIALTGAAPQWVRGGSDKLFLLGDGGLARRRTAAFDPAAAASAIWSLSPSI